MAKQRRSRKGSTQTDTRAEDQKYRKKKGSNKSRGNGTERSGANMQEGTAKVCDNDMSWYVPTPELVRDTNNFTFYNRLGDNLELKMSFINNKVTNWVNYSANMTVPGIMSLEYTPVLTNLYATPADAAKTQNLEGINIAARMLKSRLRLKNTGASAYDACDLARYCMACGSAIGVYAWLVRLYGLSRLYTQQNAYLPVALMKACGCMDPEMFIKNPATIRAMINTMALQLNTLVIPKIFPIIDRQIWLNSKVLTDGAGVKSQMYVFKPNKYLVWMTNGLAYDDSIYKSATLVTLKSNLNALMDSLLGDVSIAVIAGDILKTYTGDVYNIAQIPEEVVVVPEYMPAVMDEIQNADICPIEVSDVLTSAQGALYQTYTCPDNVPISIWNEKLLNVQNPAPTADDVMYATRLAITADLVVNKQLACGTEIITGLTIYQGDSTVQLAGTKSAPPKDSPISLNTIDAALLSQFHYHPIMCTFLSQMDGKPNKGYIVGDLENYTVLSHEEMLRIHDVAKQGLFGTSYSLVTA